ncbi:hypothetical protein M9Y10_022373 [Tritrichomonas musculus]|uniref:PQ loop repeat family protein n=1 Tax=Tritrichomonas musculus TaxID=1915356 RepID=A0ABR2KS81_9EUKA
MNSDTGYDYSLAGFTDYTSQMETSSSGIWQALGYIIFTGTVISLIPQIHSIIKRRSSYGINPMTPFISNFSQFILLFNIICLRSSDFVAATQVNFFQVLPRLMTFANAFALWIVYLPVIILNTLYFDREKRANRPTEDLHKEWCFNLLFTCLNIIGSFIILFIFFILIFVTGIGSKIITSMGKVFGTIALLSVIIQYLPQFVTTCKLRDNGSFSLLLLAIQAPGGTASALFMAIGQNDHWTTWMSTLAASIQQFCLLFLCIIFKIQRRRKKLLAEPLLGGQSSTTPNIIDPVLFDKNFLD